MHLTPKQREEAFPVHIDLGRKESGLVPMAEAGPKGKKAKPRTHYPTVYIDNVAGLEQLPKDGCMLVEFHRTRIEVSESPDGKERAGVTLELRGICIDPEMVNEGDDDGPTDLDDALGDGTSNTKADESYDDEEYD